MDALIEHPAPDESNIVNYITNKVKHEFVNYGICEDEIRLIVSHELSKFGPIGSLAAWYNITSHLLTKNVRISLRKKYGIKAISEEEGKTYSKKNTGVTLAQLTSRTQSY